MKKQTQTLGTMIATLRKKQEMTQLELATKMNVTDKAVSKWERDLSCPDVNSLPRLAELLGVSVDELMQSKFAGQSDDASIRINKIIALVFKAIVLAMGVAVVVLSILKEIDIYSGFTMLGIGLVCTGISFFQDKE